VMDVNLHSIFRGLLELGLLAGGALYTGLVLMSYLTDRSQLRPRVDWRDPAHSAERLAVWLGVKALALAVRFATKILGMLSEASADVGEWFLSNRHHESH
jgi:hypothetical protein